MRMRLTPYTNHDYQVWDEFVATCPMATFLHSRKFLAYHKDRFCDLSLMIYDDSDRLIACFPAAQSLSDPGIVISHPGITYGGMLHQGKLLGSEMVEAFKLVCSYYASRKYQLLHYKAIPNIYFQYPCDDDLYALFILNARLFRRDLGCAISLHGRTSISASKQTKIENEIKRKALGQHVVISDDLVYLEQFWQILCKNTFEKYKTMPTHSLIEIQYLIKQFPRNICLCVAVLDGRVLAGSILFSAGPVMHTQYLSISDEGRNFCALDYVIQSGIKKSIEENYRYFSFGVSTEQQGTYLNNGLYYSKYKHGGAGSVHDFYELELQRGQN